MTSPASLYERLGGIYPLAGAIDILVDRLFANVAVNANEAVRAHHGNLANAAGYKFLIAAWSIEATGGPKCYVGRDLEKVHEELHIDDKGFDASKMEIAATFSFLGVPEAEREEFLDIIESYRYQVVTASAA